MSWQPLLDGAARDRALATVQAIGDDLAALDTNPAAGPSLADGTAGLAILHGYLAQTEHGQDHAVAAGRLLDTAVAVVEAGPTPASLYSGLTGVGWAITHLQDRNFCRAGEDTVTEIDDALLAYLDETPWTGPYDLIVGLVGFSVYTLERLLPGERGCVSAPRAALERVIDHLAATAEHRPEGITWWTNPAWLIAPTSEQFPHGHYNLGLAHGVPGVIALLGRACADGVAHSSARPLLDGAVRWLLAQDRPDGFPYWIAPGAEEDRTRLAWCYGDPGVAAALFSAARCVGETAWETAALAVARRAAQRPFEQSGVRDAGLCHGAAGLGHLFNRLFQATGELWLADTARSWFARALAMRQPGRGIGGYAAWLPGDDGVLAWLADPGLLTGAAGVALALLAAATPIEPAWDRVLLAAIPPVALS
jgi:hypothetical protein